VFCVQVDPSIPSPPPFVVLAGQFFVITEIESECESNGGSGSSENVAISYTPPAVGDANNFTSRLFQFPCNSTTVEFNLQPGIVVGSAEAPITASSLNPTPTFRYVRGYLTTN
jgi:hypothetical protein